MGLRIQQADYVNFRNLGEKSISFSPSMTVLVGHNAVGKTNTIEALQLLTTGRSFKHPSADELLRQGSETGHVHLTEAGDGRVIDVELELTAEKRRFTRNGKATRPSDVAGELVSILFCPDDLTFVKGSPSQRRDEIDAFGAQMNRAYRRLAAQYEKAVEQRNHLLREPWLDEATLEAWDESIAAGGAQLLQHRCALFTRIREQYLAAYSRISPGETPDVEYVCTLGSTCTTDSREVVHSRFVAELQRLRPDERRRGRTLVGPHRDDIRFLIDGRDARVFGSQGQQRTCVLAWKMAEVEVVEQIRREKPLLLLDDVMSELDELRREALTGFAKRGVQMVVSTTNLGYFSAEMLDGAEVVRY